MWCPEKACASHQSLAVDLHERLHGWSVYFYFLHIHILSQPLCVRMYALKFDPTLLRGVAGKEVGVYAADTRDIHLGR